MSTIHQQAADTGYSVWLAAHAGSGKTKTLVDRVLRLLLEGHAPASILCLTYTRAAAVEMQVRIRSKLAKWVNAGDAELTTELVSLYPHSVTANEMQNARTLLCRLLDDSDGLRIQTIHAFCQSLLMRFPVEAGLPPGFQVAEERQQKELLEETRQSLFRHAADAEEWPDMVALLDTIARQVGDKTFVDLTHALVDEHALLFALLMQPDGLSKLHRRIFKGLNCPIDASVESILEEFLAGEEGQRPHLLQAAELLRTSGKSDNELAGTIEEWFRSSQRESDFASYKCAYLTTKNELRKDICTKNFAKQHPELGELFRDQQYRVADVHERLLALKTARFSAAIVTMADCLLTLYRQEKERRALLDYDDLILYALTLLSQQGMCEWVFTRLGRDISHLLIDEAQDTSPQQWALTRLLVEELFVPEQYTRSPRTLFVVGDAKQSIYRFQGADPAAFNAMRSEYRNWFEQSSQAFREMALQTSFRSTAAVLHVVDRFCNIPSVSRSIGEEAISHHVYRAGMGGRAVLWPLVETFKDPVPAPWEVTQPQNNLGNGPEQLAQRVAALIKGWMDEQRLLASKGRPIEPGDILILLRTRKPYMKAIIRQLRQAGVAVAGADRIQLLEHMAVKDVLALADWCLLPSDDLSLACVLKGPWFEWTEDQLFSLAYPRGEQTLWQALAESQLNESDRQKLLIIRQYSLSYAPYDWLSYLFDALEGRRLLKIQFGEEADELCDELLMQALMFESSHPCSLQYFVHWLRSSDSDIKREAEQGINAVRLLTVHGAKGLQAPIVILPDTVQRVSLKEKLWWDHVDGHPVCYVVPSGEAAPQRVEVVKEGMRQENEAESMRQLYVALTRAEDELHIMGVLPEQKIPDQCWYNVMQQVFESIEEVEKHETADGAAYQIIYPQDVSIKYNYPTGTYDSNTQIPQWVSSQAIIAHNVTISEPQIQDPAAARGTLTHALLQWMAEGTSRERLLAFAQRHNHPEYMLPLEEIIDEIWSICQNPALKWIFSGLYRSELPVLSSRFGGLTTLKRIDRLIIDKNTIHIIDFKTDRIVPATEDAIPTAYIEQLSAYAQLIRQIYSNHEIRIAILWTATAQLTYLHTAFPDEATTQLDSTAA